VSPRELENRLTRTALLWRHGLGLDGAVSFTVLARVSSIITSVGTVLLLVRFLSPVEQGYYYALLSLVLFQTVCELGFSFVIQQYAAHESVLCQFSADGSVSGDPRAHSRLASVLQLAMRWYCVASLAIALILLPAGFLFFSHKTQDYSHVDWQGPWVAVVLISAVSFMVVPLYSFLDGCGQIKEVAQARFAQSLAVLVMSWGAMIAGEGLYAPAMVNLGVVIIALGFLAPRRRLLISLLRHPRNGDKVSWRTEVWPFQWKLAVSWLCTYAVTQLFTPVLFLARGPVEAGRMGMSVNIVAYLPMLVLSWISTKVTPFGQLIKLGRLEELDRLFFRSLRQSLAVLALLVIGCMGGVIGLRYLLPDLAARMEPPGIFAFLLATAISTFIVQSMAVYLRSFKKEPFLVQSIVVSSLTLTGIAFTASQWGSFGVAAVYFVCTGLVGFLTAVAIFRSRRLLERADGRGSLLTSSAD
jgi:hypothetical protein